MPAQGLLGTLLGVINHPVLFAERASQQAAPRQWALLLDGLPRPVVVRRLVDDFGRETFDVYHLEVAAAFVVLAAVPELRLIGVQLAVLERCTAVALSRSEKG
jgi:hypothetical protein